jgi:hypothetical protein
LPVVVVDMWGRIGVRGILNENDNDGGGIALDGQGISHDDATMRERGQSEMWVCKKI